mmetsp:Transcript_24841/g.39238  ORF Transcript_24841/g.39238 Transcript_24841/m.39238 type:complete len:289 (+) Transcript_24841:2856-3722(+)
MLALFAIADTLLDRGLVDTEGLALDFESPNRSSLSSSSPPNRLSEAAESGAAFLTSFFVGFELGSSKRSSSSSSSPLPNRSSEGGGLATAFDFGLGLGLIAAFLAFGFGLGVGSPNKSSSSSSLPKRSSSAAVGFLLCLPPPLDSAGASSPANKSPSFSSSSSGPPKRLDVSSFPNKRLPFLSLRVPLEEVGGPPKKPPPPPNKSSSSSSLPKRSSFSTTFGFWDSATVVAFARDFFLGIPPPARLAAIFALRLALSSPSAEVLTDFFGFGTPEASPNTSSSSSSSSS